MASKGIDSQLDGGICAGPGSCHQCFCEFGERNHNHRVSTADCHQSLTVMMFHLGPAESAKEQFKMFYALGTHITCFTGLMTDMTQVP